MVTAPTAKVVLKLFGGAALNHTLGTENRVI